jgi:hypothetical protein
MYIYIYINIKIDNIVWLVPSKIPSKRQGEKRASFILMRTTTLPDGFTDSPSTFIIILFMQSLAFPLNRGPGWTMRVPGRKMHGDPRLRGRRNRRSSIKVIAARGGTLPRGSDKTNFCLTNVFMLAVRNPHERALHHRLYVHQLVAPSIYRIWSPTRSSSFLSRTCRVVHAGWSPNEEVIDFTLRLRGMCSRRALPDIRDVRHFPGILRREVECISSRELRSPTGQ